MNNIKCILKISQLNNKFYFIIINLPVLKTLLVINLTKCDNYTIFTPTITSDLSETL